MLDNTSQLHYCTQEAYVLSMIGCLFPCFFCFSAFQCSLLVCFSMFLCFSVFQCFFTSLFFCVLLFGFSLLLCFSATPFFKFRWAQQQSLALRPTKLYLRLIFVGNSWPQKQAESLCAESHCVPLSPRLVCLPQDLKTSCFELQPGIFFRQSQGYQNETLGKKRKGDGGMTE